MKKKIASLTIVATMALGTVTALAGTSYPEGGTWSYGRGYSKYYHTEKVHGSSCCNGNGDWDQDYNVDPGDWAKSSVTATRSGNKAYYCLGYR